MQIPLPPLIKSQESPAFKAKKEKKTIFFIEKKSFVSFDCHSYGIDVNPETIVLYFLFDSENGELCVYKIVCNKEKNSKNKI